MYRAFWFIVALVVASTVAKACHAEDIARTTGKQGVQMILTDQPCPFAGFMWWYMDDVHGHTLHTGCWTSEGRNVLITDGKGGAFTVPASKFH